MGAALTPAMLATLGGLLALLLGSAILLLPLLTPELSRPRDAAWGALVLVLGLDLVTSADRLSGAPMLGVLCAGLLIGRLGSEVARARWCMLTPEERQQLRSAARWQRSLDQLVAAVGGLLGQASGVLTSLSSALGAGQKSRGGGSVKRWVRPESPPAAAAGAEAGGEAAPASDPATDSAASLDAGVTAGMAATVAAPTDGGANATTSGAPDPALPTSPESAEPSGNPPAPPVRDVSDFSAIETLLIEAGALSPEAPAGTDDLASSDGSAEDLAQAATPAAPASPAAAQPQPDGSGPSPTAAGAATPPADQASAGGAG